MQKQLYMVSVYTKGFSTYDLLRDTILKPASVKADDLSGQIRILIAQVVNQIGYLLCFSQTSGRDLIDESD